MDGFGLGVAGGVRSWHAVLLAWLHIRGNVNVPRHAAFEKVRIRRPDEGKKAAGDFQKVIAVNIPGRLIECDVLVAFIRSDMIPLAVDIQRSLVHEQES